MTVTVIFILIITLLLPYSDEVPSCKGLDDIADFIPWGNSALSSNNCEASSLNGGKGTCTLLGVCRDDNSGTAVEMTNPRNACNNNVTVGQTCCVIKKTCAAKSTFGDGPARPGNCLGPKFCPSASSETSKLNQCGNSKNGPLACCVGQNPASDGVRCSPRYTAIEKRIIIVQNRFDDLVFTQERLTNFLPFAMKKFDELRGDKLCLPIGDCSAAAYLAFVYHMLRDFTTESPNQVVSEILQALPSTTAENVVDLLGQEKYDGHITPEAFGDLMYLLWEDKELNLMQYSSGSCADWIRMAYAVRGPESGWSCDKRWAALMAAQHCRPTKQTNLADCASGEGVCYINGNTENVCEDAGLTEITGRPGDCNYGDDIPSFCCRKANKDDKNSEISFSHNEYRNVKIVIDPKVPESFELIANITAAFTKASEMLYEATDQRAVFRTIRIVLPPTWSSQYANAKWTSGDDKPGAEFLIKPNLSLQSDGIGPYRMTMHTIQIGYCGAPGLGTTMTPMDIAAHLGPAQIVKHFAFNRYGIFHEFPRFEWELQPKDAIESPPARCVDDNSTMTLTCDGEFTVKVNHEQATATGSLAWLSDYRNDYNGVENIVHFCVDHECEKGRNHNRDMENIHNRICKQTATLNVILDSDDFSGLGTVPRKNMDTKPDFLIVHKGEDDIDAALTEDVIVMSEKMDIRPEVEKTISILLDKGLGDQTLVTVEYNETLVTAMSGQMNPPEDASDPSPSVQCLDRPGRLSCALNFKPNAGQWILKLLPKVAKSEVGKVVKVVLKATAKINTMSDTFLVTGAIVKPTIVKKSRPELLETFFGAKPREFTQAFVATLSYAGRFAVLSADVIAAVTYPDGVVRRRPLTDNGQASMPIMYSEKLPESDLYQHDGIYSFAWYDDALSPGRYNVTIEVTAKLNKAFYTPDVLLGIPKSPVYLSQTKHTRVPVAFKRILSIGSFEVVDVTDSMMMSNTPEQDEDIIFTSAPSPVTKLRLLQSEVDQDKMYFTFTWLAAAANCVPGRCGLSGGNPDYYYVSVSTNILNVQGRGEEIEVTNNTDRNLLFANFKRDGQVSDRPGEPILMTVTLPTDPWRKAKRNLYFSVTAYNIDVLTMKAVRGAYSNIATFSG